MLSKLVEALREGKAARGVELTKEEALIAKGYQLLTAKPMIYVANMSEDDIADPENNGYYQKVKAYAEAENNDVIAICAQIEEELSSLEKEEKRTFLEELGIPESGLDRVIKSAYHLLGLKTYFTAGEPENSGPPFITNSKNAATSNPTASAPLAKAKPALLL